MRPLCCSPTMSPTIYDSHSHRLFDISFVCIWTQTTCAKWIRIKWMGENDGLTSERDHALHPTLREWYWVKSTRYLADCAGIFSALRGLCVCVMKKQVYRVHSASWARRYSRTHERVCVCVAVLLLAGWYCSPPCNLSDISKQSGIIMRIERAWRAYARAFASKSASCRSRCGRGWACRSNWNLLVIIITVSHCECFCRILNTDQARPGNKYVEVIIIHTAECESDKILHKY